MSKCGICKDTGQLKINVMEEQSVNGIACTVPAVKYVVCPECKMAELEAMYINILDANIAKYEATLDKISSAAGGTYVASTFEIDESLLKTAKSNPHELLQRLMTKTIDDMKEEIFESCIYKVEYDMTERKYIVLTRLIMMPMSVANKSDQWKDLDQFDDWLCKKIL